MALGRSTWGEGGNNVKTEWSKSMAFLKVRLNKVRDARQVEGLEGTGFSGRLRVLSG